MEQRQQPSDEDRLPQGLLMVLAQNMRAMEHYAALDGAGRARLVAQALQVLSREEIQRLVEHIGDFL